MSFSIALSEKIKYELAALEVYVIDESAKHLGHGSFNGQKGTHLRVTIVSPYFINKSRIERMRMVHRILAEELNTTLHALSLHLLTPDEHIYS